LVHSRLGYVYSRSTVYSASKTIFLCKLFLSRVVRFLFLLFVPSRSYPIFPFKLGITTIFVIVTDLEVSRS
jgi:hypothetical protein